MDLKTAAVEPMTRPSLEQMLATIPQQSQSLLGQKVSDTHLDEIARALTDWRSVCTKLGISEPEEEAIKEENQTTAAQRYVDLHRRGKSGWGVRPWADYTHVEQLVYVASCVSASYVCSSMQRIKTAATTMTMATQGFIFDKQ